MDDDALSLIIINKQNLCRLCLCTKGAMSDIFEDSDDDNSLVDLIYLATGVKLKKEHGLPHMICHKCRYIVELNHEHRTVVEHTQAMLLAQQENVEYLDMEDETSTKLTNSRTPSKRKKVLPEITKNKLRIILDENGKMLLVKHEDDDQELGVNTEHEDLRYDYENVNNDLGNSSGVRAITPNRQKRTAPKNLTCQICLTPFPTEEEVQGHARTHYENCTLTCYLDWKYPYGCEMCQGRPLSKTRMIEHHRQHLNVYPFGCKHPDCNFIGKDRGALRHHEKIHSERRHTCDACGVAFKTSTEMLVHTRRVHDNEARTCRRCGVECRNIYTYKHHMQRHIKPPRFKCGQSGCKKSFYSRYDQLQHERAHAGRRQYPCEQCDVAAFTSASLLKRHMRAHARNAPRRCNTCALTFDTHADYTAHVHREHDIGRAHPCPACHARCKSEAQLIKHQEKCKHMEVVFEDTARTDEEKVITCADPLETKQSQISLTELKP